MIGRRIGWLAVVVTVAVAWAPTAAQAVTLDTLTAGGSITCGDKLFDDFTYLATGDMPTEANINVNCITIDGNIGLQFQGAFADLPGGGSSDALIEYTVTVTDPTQLIIDAHILGNPDVVGGTGAMVVTDTWVPDSNNQMSIFDIAGGATQLTDATDFPQGFTTLHVQKNILGIAGTGVATLSFVDQTYSQIIPEPGTLILLGTGLLGLFGYAWRRRA